MAGRRLREQSLSKTRMAATRDVTLSTLGRAAALVGRKLSITLV